MANTIGNTAVKKDSPVKEEIQSGRIQIGNTTYYINVHFGKIPLEEILKNRILNSTKTA